MPGARWLREPGNVLGLRVMSSKTSSKRQGKNPVLEVANRDHLDRWMEGGALVEADHARPALIYLNNHCLDIKDNDVKAIGAAARDLFSMGMPENWITEELTELCKFWS